ncbi:MAG: phospholipase D-like domain-containing protein, partial [Gemmatimonadota bacterium]
MLWYVMGGVAGLLVIVILLNLYTAIPRAGLSIEPLYGVDSPQFIRSIGTLLGPGILEGNQVQVLLNGDQIFPAMLTAIRGAKRTITFETYIYWSGEIGREFADALCDRARNGVRVHLLLDWVGAGKIDHAIVKEMRSAGVEVENYRPLKWYNLARLNNRTHRKLLVIDGTIGFTGGVGIADIWSGYAQDPDHWRDTHFALRGPAVAQMQAAFLDNWLKLRPGVLHGDDYFPPLTSAGDARGQVFKSSFGEGSESARLMYMLSIASAKHSILLSNAYFVPDQVAIAEIVAARRRGVRVEIIVPGRHIDSRTVRLASRGQWGPLLEAGVEIFEYQPTMFHVKVMVIDGIWSSVGSTNFDPRSFCLN